MPTIKDVLNQANPSVIASQLRVCKVGDIFRALPVYAKGLSMTVAPTDMIATVGSFQLPNDAKAEVILRAYGRTNTGSVSNGPLTIAAGRMTSAPSTLNVQVTESGDIAGLASDAWTAVDILYIPRKFSSVITLTLPVVAGTGVCALPPAVTSAGMDSLLSATVTVGSVTGPAFVIANGTAPTNTHNVNMDLSKTQVQFRVADAVTAATLTIGLMHPAAEDLNLLLEATSTYLL